MQWLTQQLTDEVKHVFEPRYQREISDDEASDIAESLTNFMEDMLKFYEAKQYENQKN